MQYAEKIEGQWVEKTKAQFLKDKGASIPNGNLEAAGLLEVTVDPQPDTSSQIVEPGPLVDRSGRPVQTWVVRDMTPEELAAIEVEKSAQFEEILAAVEGNSDRDKVLFRLIVDMWRVINAPMKPAEALSQVRVRARKHMQDVRSNPENNSGL